MNINWYQHQLDALKFLKQRHFGALFMETGTGKSPVAIGAMEHFYAQGLRRFVVVCPFPLTGNWVEELRKWDSHLKPVRIDQTTRDRRLDAIHSDWDVLLIGYATIRTLAPYIIQLKPQGFILDEIQRVKDRRTIQTKSCRDVSAIVKRQSGFVYGLTGTPIIKSPLDLWSEFDVLNPGTQSTEHPLGYGSFTSYENSISIWRPHPHLGSRVKLYHFPTDRLKVLTAKVSQLAYEIRKDQCLDLPPREWKKIYVDMKEDQLRVYNDLRKESVAYLDTVAEGDPLTQRVSASVIIALLTKLHQVTSGFVKNDVGEEIDLASSAKLDALEEVLPDWTDETWNHKTIVFARFRRDIDNVKKLCDRLKIKSLILDGRNSAYSELYVKQFQNDNSIRVLISNAQVGGLGHTLVAADYMCFFSNSFSMGDRSQAEDRIYRIGQTRKVVYYDLICKNTIDTHILNNLREKRELADQMSISRFKAILKGETDVAYASSF